MQGSAWRSGNTYGIRVGPANREEFFDPIWKSIDVEMDGRVNRFELAPGFWRHCPEFRDPRIREWLESHRALKWPFRQPPRVELIPLGGAKFRLLD